MTGALHRLASPALRPPIVSAVASWHRAKLTLARRGGVVFVDVRRVIVTRRMQERMKTNLAVVDERVASREKRRRRGRGAGGVALFAGQAALPAARAVD